ncbi:MAG: TlpA family protein disulfide reductase [Deltaproteobacteria bacterium]|nr:TlpA family protein disulfide reductase [Deltaproteobacteria bacterium]
MKTVGFVAVLAVAGLACSRSEKEKEKEKPPATTTATPPKVETPTGPPPLSWYRVEVIADVASSVPFFLGVDPKADRAVIDNGEEEQLEALLLSRDPVRVRVAVLGGEVTLVPDGTTGKFKGEWTAKTLIKEPFRVEASRVDAPSPQLRFPGDAPPTSSLDGGWRIEIKDFGTGRAMFKQDAAGNLSGSVLPPDVGDTRYLSGRVIGDRFSLSTFDGMHAHLLDGTIEDGGKQLRGRWIAAGFGEWTFTATRAEGPKAISLVTARMKKGKKRVTVPALTQPPYVGQPVVVEFFGTWCSACMDLMPKLIALEKQYRDQGLKVLMIALEPAGDEAEGMRRIEELRTKYGIKWDIDVRFAEDLLADIPPEIDNALGFPLTIFVRRDGTVAGVQSAYISAAAQAENSAVDARFDALAKEIVESPPPK